MNDINLTAIMRREGIRNILMHPAGFTITLNAGWPCGYGDTVGKALDDAKAKHAARLDRAA